MPDPITHESTRSGLQPKTRATSRRRLLLVLTVFSMIALGYAGCSWQNHRSALECVQTWAQVAAVPEGASETRLSVGGSMFTRSFILEFDAAPAELDAWLIKSPGLSGVTYQTILEEIVRNKTFTRPIVPGDKACFAQATFVRALNGRIRVIVYTYWS